MNVDRALVALMTSKSCDCVRERTCLGLWVLEPKDKVASSAKFSIKFDFQCAECRNLITPHFNTSLPLPGFHVGNWKLRTAASNNNGGDKAASKDGGEKKKGDEGEMKEEESPSPSSSRIGFGCCDSQSHQPRRVPAQRETSQKFVVLSNGLFNFDPKIDVAYCIHASFKKIKQDVNYIGEN
ncbi:hypothetical protein DVH24_033801 [Malus domestica]|uniref:Uncharacterized protein n=1 Tax=Malus domestica TaxID=3750 RepID=A0A498HTQ2_MALDO|nr:hypothetical protein DVH24_033801 [Malus domestica]